MSFHDYVYGKHPWKSRTVWVNVATAVAEILTLPALGEFVPAEYRAHIAVANAVANVWLRTKGGKADLDWGAMLEAVKPLLKKK